MKIIYKTIPLHTAEKVPLDQEMEVYFSVDIHAHTLRQENVLLFNMTEQRVEPTELSYQRRLLKIRPTHKLKPNNHYQVQLLGGPNGIKDIIGREMPQTEEIEFHTKDAEGIKPPTLVYPTDLSIVFEPVTFQWRNSTDADYYELQVSKSNTFHNVEWPKEPIAIYNTDVTPDIPYSTGTYYARARSIDAEGKASAWSPVIRYHYNGEPIIQVPDDPIIEEPVEPEAPEDIQAQSVIKKIVLHTNSQLHSEPNQLASLQQALSIQPQSTFSTVHVKSTVPKDKSVHRTLASFNQARQIIIEFTEDMDPASIHPDTCYVLSERN